MHLWMMRGISHWEILPNFSPSRGNQHICLFYWRGHYHNSGMYLIGISCCLYSDTDADEICIDSGGIVYLPMWVNILIRTLATVALFDFMNVSLGEGALIFGMVYNFCLL